MHVSQALRWGIRAQLSPLTDTPAMDSAIRAPLTPARVWWSAVRPVTLVASVAPVIAGTAVALNEGDVNWVAGLGALLVAVAMQLGVNFANDYSDHVRGADKQRVGPVRASSSGVVKPEHVRMAAGAAFGVAALG